MNLLILNASPKKKGGASRFFSGLFRLFLPGVRKKVVSLSCQQDFQRVLELLPGMDVVCLFVPLYVDGLPSHIVEFLIQAEGCCKNHPCQFRLYVLANNGFVEGKQNRPALNMLQAWCERAEITWVAESEWRRGDAPGIGDIYPILIGIILLQMAIIPLQHRHHFRRIMAFFRHPDVNMAFLQ